MKDAKELFEQVLGLHRRMEKLSLIEKGAVISIVNALFLAEVQEAREAQQRSNALLNMQQAQQPVGDEYQKPDASWNAPGVKL